MRRTRLLGRHVRSDAGFIAEMSLYGGLHQIPRYQMYRRVHEDSSSVKPGDHAHAQRRYHAANVNRIPFNRWMLHQVNIAAALRSPLPLRDKLRLAEPLARHLYWDRGELVRATIEDLRWMLQRRVTQLAIPGKSSAWSSTKHG